MNNFTRKAAEELQQRIKADEQKPAAPHEKRLKIDNPKGVVDSIKKVSRASTNKKEPRK